MQPNNNTNTFGSAAPAPTPTPMATPASTPMNPGSDIVFKDKPKKNKGMLIGMVALALLAAGGIGFGIWAYLSGNQKVASLNNQISDLQNQLAEQEQESEEIIIDEDTGSEINTADYIYVGEWGLKIKIPNELKMASYALQHYKYDNQEDVSSIVVSGVIGDINSLPDYANIEKCGGLGSIGRLKKGTETLEGNLVFSDDNYDYQYSHPQATCSIDASEQASEAEVTNLIQNILTDANNYSKI